MGFSMNIAKYEKQEEVRRLRRSLEREENRNMLVDNQQVSLDRARTWTSAQHYAAVLILQRGWRAYLRQRAIVSLSPEASHSPSSPDGESFSSSVSMCTVSEDSTTPDSGEDGMDLESDSPSRSGSESGSSKVTPCSDCKSSPSIDLCTPSEYDNDEDDERERGDNGGNGKAIVSGGRIFQEELTFSPHFLLKPVLNDKCTANVSLMTVDTRHKNCAPQSVAGQRNRGTTQLAHGVASNIPIANEVQQIESNTRIENVPKFPELSHIKPSIDLNTSISQKQANIFTQIKSLDKPSNTKIVKTRPSNEFNKVQKTMPGSTREFPVSSKLPPSNRQHVPQSSKARQAVPDTAKPPEESPLPTMDWEALERHLAGLSECSPITTSKDSSQPLHGGVTWAQRNERESIRQKLALGGFLDEGPGLYTGCSRSGKPSLSSRLQSGMNLQICFVNDSGSDKESDGDESSKVDSSPMTPPSPISKQSSSYSERGLAGSEPGTDSEAESLEELDFLGRQRKLQAEARLALAMARPMARMQVEVERQNRKKSPVADLLPNLQHISENLMKHSLKPADLEDMTIGQLQVIVNDLHSQIENLNEELMQLLLVRDELHMEQDAMLVDIEDLTRHGERQQKDLVDGPLSK
uniref:Schwannomin interacting protein 1 C-terminal domain-containing protein n=3 Tax=Eptatretus burgeri TaxID=7764 RepID=A0A8C4WY62_EPTBU